MGSKLFRSDILRGDPLSFSTLGLLVAVFIYQVLFTFQGLDCTDTGFHMTAYQRIFSDPETVHYSFMFWLSDVLGGLWMKLFPGLWANRLAVVLVHSVTFWLYFLLLRPMTGANKAAIYSCLSLLFFQYYGFETLNYDSFTVVAFSIATYFFVCGIWRGHLRLLCLGAFICGVSTYLRITNIAAVGFLPLAWICHVYYHGHRKKALLMIGSTVLSYALGHGVVLVAMAYMGHLELFFSNMAFVKSMGAAGDSSHGFFPVMKLYLIGWVKVGIAAVFVAALAYVHNRYKSRQWLFWAIGLSAICWLGLLVVYPTEVWSKMRYMLYGSVLLSTAQAVLQADKKVTTLAIFGLALMAVFPLGSDSGLEKMYFATGLSVGLLFWQLDTGSRVEGSIRLVLLVMYVVTCGYFGYSNTYFDGGSRQQKTAAIDHPDLKYIHTTPERAAEVQLLIGVLDTLAAEDQYLLAFSDIPMVHYLTKTRPYIGTSWPKLYYDSEIFHEELLLAKEKHGLPLIVIQKMEMRSGWPTNTTPNYLDLELSATNKRKVNGRTFWTHPENRLVTHYFGMFSFLYENDYNIIWESEVFRIYSTR